MRNWLIRLGWSHGDQEILSRDEIIEYFDLDTIGRSGAQADRDKLSWLNQHYIKELSADDLFRCVSPFLDTVANGPVPRSVGLDTLLDLLRERSKTLSEMAGRASWLILDSIEYDPKAAKKHLKPDALEIVVSLHERMESLPDWSEGSLEEAFAGVSAQYGDLKMGKLAQPIRVAVTGGPFSPGIYETLAVLGRERSLERIAKAISFIRGLS
jgi:glutamyl-tRNA synthetase